MKVICKFESVIILKTSVTEEEKQEIISNCKKIINDEKMQVEDFGIKKLAYQIRGNNQGRYISLNYEQEEKSIVDLERYFRIDDKIIKFITIRKDD